MHTRGRSKASLGQGTSRHGRPPRSSMGPGKQGLSSWVLLAHRSSTRPHTRPTLCWLSALCDSTPHVPNGSLDDSDHLDFSGLGSGYGRTKKKKYLLVMVDKFTKWIEAKPESSAKVGLVIDFISNVVHRYGVPHIIIMGNGSNFAA